MDKNSYLAIVISIAIIFIWSMFFKPEVKENPIQKEKVVQNATEEKQNNKKEKISIEQTKNINLGPEKVYTLENDFLKLEFSSHGASIKQIFFKKYKDKNGEILRFFSNKVDKGFYSNDIKNLKFKLLKVTENSVMLAHNNIRVEYSLKTPYSLSYKTNLEKDKHYTYTVSSFVAEEGISRYGLDTDPEKREKFFITYENEKIEENSLEKLRKNIYKYDYSSWAAIADRYFIFAALAESNNIIEQEDSIFKLQFDTKAKDFDFYIGPKDIDYLNAADPTLRNVVDFGILSILAVPMLELMKFLYGIIPNYGVAIILLTLIVRLIMFPLQHKSMKSMKRMQELQPYIKKLQEKYKDDKEKLNKEMMQFMKTHKMNPMGGCFPMLLQLPVFIALYKVLSNAVELYRSPFIFWIKDLSVKDPYYVMPVLMGLMMFLQQKMTPSPTMDSAQSKMMLIMPVMFTFLMISLPSGLTLYIMFSTLLGVLQQYFLNRKPKEIAYNGN